ncbi:MAG: TauD/TfdA family dioxygenase [Gammaproteobacteria bacterium]
MSVFSSLKSISPTIGAEIFDVDLKKIDGDLIDELKKILSKYKVLFFPNQNLTIDDHVAFGEKFGELQGHPHINNPSIKHPKIFELAASSGGIADEWHTDLTFQEEPALLSILHMVQIPSVGGDTMWTDLVAAFKALSKPMQDMCIGLSALHDASPHLHPEKMTIHPVVRKHPDTQEPVLYVNEHFTRRIVELRHDESDHLLSFLTAWVQKPEFSLRYKWQQHTIAMWDNRATQHYVVNNFEGERIIQRVTVTGDIVEPFGKLAYQAWNADGKFSAKSRYDFQLMGYLDSHKK